MVFIFFLGDDDSEKNKYFLVWYFSGSNVGERSLSKRAASVFICKIIGI